MALISDLLWGFLQAVGYVLCHQLLIPWTQCIDFWHKHVYENLTWSESNMIFVRVNHQSSSLFSYSRHGCHLYHLKLESAIPIILFMEHVFKFFYFSYIYVNSNYCNSKLTGRGAWWNANRLDKRILSDPYSREIVMPAQG